MSVIETGATIPKPVPIGFPTALRPESVSRVVSRAIEAVPPPGLLLLSMVSMQIGATLAIQLFPALGPTGTVLLRVAISAAILALATRPAIDSTVWAHWRLLLLFGFVLATMNLSFYEAIARIPLGIAATIQFIGPLGVAVATSRRLIDFLWIALAIVGIGMLTPSIGGVLDPLGVFFALIAAAGWAGFILVSRRVGRAFKGGSGLALAMIVAAVLLLPFGIARISVVLVEPTLLLGAITVAILSTTIPFSLEFKALKHLSPRAYGMLISLEPAVAVIIGGVLLAESVGWVALLAVGFVMTAAIGMTFFERRGSDS